MMLIKLGMSVEIELGPQSLYVRLWSFSRYWNTQDLPSH